jgi:hypothetical protein
MLKIMQAIYKNNRLIFKERKEKPEDGSEVVVIFNKKNEKKEKKPLSLFGIWKKKFPDDFDLDKEIYKIRAEWKTRLENING